VRLIDVHGTVVQLPLDLRDTFARFVARQQVNYMKRFCVDRVFRGGVARDSTPTGGQPRDVLEANFDIVWRLPSAHPGHGGGGGGGGGGGAVGGAAGGGAGLHVRPPRPPLHEHDGLATKVGAEVLEAEVMLVAAEVMQSLSRHLNGYYFRINHSRVGATHCVCRVCVGRVCYVCYVCALPCLFVFCFWVCCVVFGLTSPDLWHPFALPHRCDAVFFLGSSHSCATVSWTCAPSQTTSAWTCCASFHVAPGHLGTLPRSPRPRLREPLRERQSGRTCVPS